MRYEYTALSTIAFGLASAVPTSWKPSYEKVHQKPLNVQMGPRPYYLVENMDAGPLKEELQSCTEGPFTTSDFTIGHRGAPLQFPEHSRESYMAAIREGAGIVECDVAFTSDKQLVCRHSHCDLHTTTNILQIPELAAKCTSPFTPASNGTEASANCCTSDITLADFKSLCAKMDGTPNPNATTLDEYLTTPVFRTDLYATCGTVMTHEESIDLIDSYGLQFTPELKTPSVEMPFDGYTQEQFAQDVIEAYKRRNIDPARVWPQSFLIDDIYYWIQAEPEFGQQAVYLDERVDTVEGYVNATAGMGELVANGVRVLAPPIFALVQLENNETIVPSDYALAAKDAGLKIVAWSFERSGFLNEGGDYYYYTSVAPVINNDGDMYTVLDVLVKQVGIFKMFSDWPATVAYYANCFGL